MFQSPEKYQEFRVKKKTSLFFNLKSSFVYNIMIKLKNRSVIMKFATKEDQDFAEEEDIRCIDLF